MKSEFYLFLKFEPVIVGEGYEEMFEWILRSSLYSKEEHLVNNIETNDDDPRI